MAKFLFINNALSGTGGARVLLNLSESLVENGHEVSILLDRVDNIDFEVISEIKIYQWSIWGIHQYNYRPNYSQKVPVASKNALMNVKLKSILRAFRDFRYVFFYPLYIFFVWKFFRNKKFDLVLNSNIYIGIERHWFLSKLSAKYFAFFHNSPVEVFSRADFFSTISLKFIFDAVSCISVSEGIKRELIDLGLGAVENNLVIYNSFDFNKILLKSLVETVDYSRPYILSVSTLTDRKRVDRIIRAYALNTRMVELYDLIIVGLGDKEFELKHLVNQLGIKNSVKFIGFIKNPYPLMASASLLVLTSDSEGLPTVLIESLSLGTPVISTDCPTGPSEILEPWGEDVLVELESDNEILIKNISRKMFSLLELNLTTDVVIKKSNLSRFESGNIITQWERLI